ncbi:FabD/lysophospholipase-like protein [Lindgomyces ingoldianus]|uniref:FabD/lysophospholipase-like protein n=1 Tax=Lindgomyces ingoldianus TaxID=673940 RepID=A0ACB6RDW1_9PLEO|nr:FabD/lysophospholipase-like protein [Lindgomyces ingoldianus]KAF2477529.1 FabD/lysophospholipase-like protein [Lindgomyces ingoldianus]
MALAPHTSPAGDEPVNLLALDGGGIRGVSELLILDEIMRRVQCDSNLAEMPLPCDYFDLIGGTSTGGLIALMLGRLRMTTDEALRTYNSLARAIFSKDNKERLGQDGAFKATTLQNKVQEVVSKKGLGELMLDPSNDLRRGKAFVCAVPANSMAYPRLFRTYPVRALASANCRIWEAARATTAAPTFFKHIAIGGKVLEEARNIFGNDRLVRCLISIGTGHPGTIGLAKPDAFQKVLPTKLISETANGLSARFKDLEKFYFRFNVAHGAEGISLEEWDKMGELTEHTKAYMAEVSVSKAIDEVVDMLCNPREVRVTLGSVCQLV